MGSVFNAAIVVIMVFLFLPAVPEARMVYLNDGAVLHADAVWRTNGKVTIIVNHEAELTLPEREVNINKTFRSLTTAGKLKASRTVQKKSKPVQEPLSSAGRTPAKLAVASRNASGMPSRGPVTTAAATSPQNGVTVLPVGTSATAAPVTTQPPPPSPAVQAPPPAQAPPVQPAVSSLPTKHPLPGGAEFPVQKISALGMSTIYGLIGGILLLAIILIVSFWKVFEKAGQAGWKSLIPIYNYVVFLSIIEKPVWWIILLFVPVVSFIILIIMHVELAKRFGKGLLYGLGLCFLPVIFFPLLAFGDATYE